MADETQYGPTPTLDEIVFEKRNKEYGAYDLRRQYPWMLTKSFLIGTIAFLLVAFTPFIIMKIKQMNAAEKTEVDANLLEILDDQVIEVPLEEEPPPPPPPKEPEPEVQEVIQNIVPEPTKAPKVETPPPPIQKQLETTTGIANVEGVKKPEYTPPPPPPSTGTKAATVDLKPPVDEKKVYTEVEQLAEFPGGINAFRNKVQSNFDGSAIDDEGNQKAEITFIVERDGTLTDVKATGSNKYFNDEAIRTVKSIKNKWTPAKVNGQTVRYRYKLPITMAF